VLFEVDGGVPDTAGVGVPVTVGAGVSGLAGPLVPPLQAASSAAVTPANKSFWRMFKNIRSTVSIFALPEI
jgi:hypothetical protein